MQTTDAVDVKTRKLRRFFCAMQPSTTAFSRARMPDEELHRQRPCASFCGAASCATKISIPCLDRVYINPTSAAVVAWKNEIRHCESNSSSQMTKPPLFPCAWEYPRQPMNVVKSNSQCDPACCGGHFSMNRKRTKRGYTEIARLMGKCCTGDVLI